MAKFKPGERVLVEAVVVRVEDNEPRIRLPNHVECWIGRDVVHPLPTQASHLRAAAEVLKAMGKEISFSNRAYPTTYFTDILGGLADHLEAASAPKPEPTLREAAEALLARWPTDQHADSPLKDEADALRAALAREETSKE